SCALNVTSSGRTSLRSRLRSSSPVACRLSRRQPAGDLTWQLRSGHPYPRREIDELEGFDCVLDDDEDSYGFPTLESAMKPITLIVVLFAAIVSAQAPKTTTPATRSPLKEYTMAQFLDTTSIQGASFSADESKILFSSNKSGVWNAYTVSIAGGAWTPVTKST